MLHDLFANLFATIYLYFECMLIGTIVADAIAAKHEPEPDKDFVIVLGCGLMPDGTPTPLLRGRLDRALAFGEKQEAATGRAPTTNYHVFRSGLFARRVKMRAVGMGAETKWFFWPNAAVREFVGLLTKHRVKQALILGCMVVIYGTLTLLAYR